MGGGRKEGEEGEERHCPTLTRVPVRYYSAQTDGIEHHVLQLAKKYIFFDGTHSVLFLVCSTQDTALNDELLRVVLAPDDEQVCLEALRSPTSRVGHCPSIIRARSRTNHRSRGGGGGIFIRQVTATIVFVLQDGGGSGGSVNTSMRLIICMVQSLS